MEKEKGLHIFYTLQYNWFSFCYSMKLGIFTFLSFFLHFPLKPGEFKSWQIKEFRSFLVKMLLHICSVRGCSDGKQPHGRGKVWVVVVVVVLLVFPMYSSISEVRTQMLLQHSFLFLITYPLGFTTLFDVIASWHTIKRLKSNINWFILAFSLKKSNKKRNTSGFIKEKGIKGS